MDSTLNKRNKKLQKFTKVSDGKKENCFLWPRSIKLPCVPNMDVLSEMFKSFQKVIKAMDM